VVSVSSTPPTLSTPTALPYRGRDAGNRRSASAPPAVPSGLLQTPARPGGPLWVDAPAFNLNDQVHVEELHRPADEAELLRPVARLRRHRLDMSISCANSHRTDQTHGRSRREEGGTPGRLLVCVERANSLMAGSRIGVR
jgi:hypothetical protein